MHNVTQLYPTGPTIEEAVLGREHSIFEESGKRRLNFSPLRQDSSCLVHLVRSISQSLKKKCDII